jgi:NAD kinase
VELKVGPKEKVVLSIDGQAEVRLSNGRNVTIKLSPYTTHFLKIREPGYFYGSLWQKLAGRRNEG